jgi:hypothetical protein
MAGLMRQFRAADRAAENKDNRALIYDELATHVYSALAEALVAKTIGQYWSGATRDRTVADVGMDVEVRHTPLNKGGLIFRPSDKESSKYYLVTGIYPKMQVVGWMYGKDCKQNKYLISKDKNGDVLSTPYYLVPQCDLTSDLIEVIL